MRSIRVIFAGDLGYLASMPKKRESENALDVEKLDWRDDR
jgi:hypothetical protein